MDNASANPAFVFLLCVARCLVPVLLLLGVSYLLRRFGFIKSPPSPPDDFKVIENDNPLGEGGLSHENEA
jgi:hypothetical protein